MLGLYRIDFKLLSAAAGCEVHGSALSAEKVLDVPQHDSESFPPPALPTDFSLIFATKPAWKSVLAKVHALMGEICPTGLSGIPTASCAVTYGMIGQKSAEVIVVASEQ